MKINDSLQILCFNNEKTVQGLQWALEQSDSRYQYRFFYANLFEISEQESLEYDLLLLPLDLGQPVPIESLKVFASKPGICTFIQPTPSQLLSLNQLMNWKAFMWDQSDYVRLFNQIESFASEMSEQIAYQQFASICSQWVKKESDQCERIVFMNAPKEWPYLTELVLQEEKSPLSLGSQGSVADLKLPIEGNKILAELFFTKGSWFYRDVGKGRSTPPKALRPYDRVRLLDFELLLRPSESAEKINSIANQLSLSSFSKKEKASVEGSVYDVCLSHMLLNASGELQVSSNLKKGSVFFQGGYIYQAYTGAVSSQKALLRMFSWSDKLEFKFVDSSVPDKAHRELSLGARELSSLYKEWIQSWKKIHKFLPPAAVRLLGDPARFPLKKRWSSREYRVMAGVCEHELVRDIMNFVTLNDHEIIETLVVLRQEGLIYPKKV